MLARIIIGLGMTVLFFSIAGRRFYWLSKLIRSGQPAPRRWQGFRKVSETEVVEVAGQKKLLQWTVPGLAHFFTMWGFTILMTTILEAYGSLFSRNFHIPLIGRDNWLGFTEDFFATAVLVSLVVFTIIRIKNAPSRKERESRFYGSHLGAAWAVLFMISMVIITLLLYRGAQINTGHFPFTRIPSGHWVAVLPSPPTAPTTHFYASFASPWAFASKIVASWLAPLGVGVNSVLEAVFLLLNIAVIAGFLVFVSYSKHLHIFLAPINVGVSRRPRALGGLDKTPDMDMEQRHRRHGLRRRQDGGLHLEADARLLDVHRVRTMSIGLSRLDDRQATESEAADHGTAREHVRVGRSTALGRVQRRRRDAGADDDRPRRPVVLHHVRQLRRAVPGRHRARRRHHRHAPLRGDDGVSRFPTEAALLLRNMENQGDPWGLGSSQRTKWLDALDFEVPVIDGVDSRRRRVPLLGRLRRIARRAGSQAGGLDRADAAPRGRHLRRPRTARVLHRRPGASHGQRVPLPGDGEGQYRDAQRCRREEDRRELSPLLQHDEERVPRSRRRLRTDPPRAVAEPPRGRRQARAGRRPTRGR